MADKTQHFKTAAKVKKAKREAWIEGALFVHSREHNESDLPDYIAERNPYGPPFPGTNPKGGKR